MKNYGGELWLRRRRSWQPVQVENNEETIMKRIIISYIVKSDRKLKGAKGTHLFFFIRK